MSVITANTQACEIGSRTYLLARVGIATVAACIVAVGLMTLAYAVFATGMVSPPAPRNPFATGGSASSPTTFGIGGLILTIQAHFYAALTAAVQSLKAEGVGLISLATIGFFYGIFHAVGPGHGKGVISGYIIASKGSVSRGLALSLAAALLQAIVAIVLVSVFALLLNATAATINAAARNIELASFAAVAGLGAILIWSKAGDFLHLAGAHRAGRMTDDDRAVPLTGRKGNWRSLSGVVIAAGMRPCSGAIILLVFALSQGLFAAGIVGALAMAIGTFMTTGALASLTVFAKALLERFTAGGGRVGHLAFAGFELLAAAFVLILGVALFAGVWTGGSLLSSLD